MFARNGIRPQHRLGQNFLVDLNIHDLIMDTAEVGPDDVILEIGSGTGALTASMAARGAHVIAVDIDPAMSKLTAEAVAGLSNAQVLLCDALANKNRIEPKVLDLVRLGLASGEGKKRFKLVANLPYHVATPLIVNLLVHDELCPALIVVTIQKEVAERLCAPAATSAYGAVSVVVQALADVAIVRTLPPSVFWPQPKVESAVVCIKPDGAKRAAVGNVPWFHEMVRRLFFHRRKYIRHVLASDWSDRWTKADVDLWLQTLGLNSQLRAESLTVPQFLALVEALRLRWGDQPHEASFDMERGEPVAADEHDGAE